MKYLQYSLKTIARLGANGLLSGDDVKSSIQFMLAELAADKEPCIEKEYMVLVAEGQCIGLGSMCCIEISVKPIGQTYFKTLKVRANIIQPGVTEIKIEEN